MVYEYTIVGVSLWHNILTSSSLSTYSLSKMLYKSVYSSMWPIRNVSKHASIEETKFANFTTNIFITFLRKLTILKQNECKLCNKNACLIHVYVGRHSHMVLFTALYVSVC